MEENPERCRGQRVSDLETGAMFLEQFEFLEQPTTLSARPLSCLGTSFIDVSGHGSYFALLREGVLWFSGAERWLASLCPPCS